MKHKFTLGAVAGASALIVAVPLFAQFAGAASVSSSAPAAVSQSVAEQTALAAHPGTIGESTKNDRHFGGYKIEISGKDGKEYDVIVDATTGKITDSWVDGQDGPRHGHYKNEADDNDAEVNDGSDQNDANDLNEATDQPETGAQGATTPTSSAATSQIQK